MAVLVTYTFSLDRGISIKLRIGLRVGIASIFGEDPKQRYYLSSRSVALGNDEFFVVCHMDTGRRVVRTQIDRLPLFHLSHRSFPPPPLAAAGRTCHREMSSSRRRFSSRSS